MAGNARGRNQRRLGAALVFLCIGVTSGAAYASVCDGKETSMMDMTSCAADAARRADAELNSVYGDLRAKIDVLSQSRLRDAQRAWVSFRDQECVFRTGGGLKQEGDIWPMEVFKCQEQLTRSRIKELREQIKCQSWDLSCPAR